MTTVKLASFDSQVTMPGVTLWHLPRPALRSPEAWEGCASLTARTKPVAAGTQGPAGPPATTVGPAMQSPTLHPVTHFLTGRRAAAQTWIQEPVVSPPFPLA